MNEMKIIESKLANFTENAKGNDEDPTIRTRWCGANLNETMQTIKELVPNRTTLNGA